MGTFVSTERRGAVALVTIDNPPMNALSAALLEELEAEVDALDARRRRSARSCSAAGASGRSSPARTSRSSRRCARAPPRAARRAASRSSAHRMDAAHTPFVAAIHGYCLGGGLELAMCCDVRICADDATLGQPEIKLGLIPGGGGTQRLPRLVGLGRAMLLNLTGEFVDAETAYAWGLVERVVPVAELEEAALAVAGQLAAQSPHAVGVLRELARTTRDLPLEEGLRREADGFRRCLRSRGRRRGRRRVHREARAEVHRPLRTLVVIHHKRCQARREGGRPRGGAAARGSREVPDPEPGDGQVARATCARRGSTSSRC